MFAAAFTPAAVVVFAFAAAAFVVILAGSPREAEGAAGSFEYALPVNAAQMSDDELNKALDTAKGAGVDSISTGAVWWYLNGNRAPRSYDWSSLDRLVAGAEARGMKVSLQLSGTPDWVHPNLASSEPDFFKRIWYPPRGAAELDAWYKFVQDVVTRYEGRVARYEMWNETNLVEYWRPGPNPGEYAELLRSGYLAAKAIDPSATVVFAGLSRNEVGYLNRFYERADALYGADARQNDYYFDVLGVHPYSDARSPDTYSSAYVGQGPWGPVDRNFLGLRSMKAAMEAKGGAEAAKTIWVGEMGYSTTRTWMEAVPDATRAKYLERAYALARGLGYVDGLSWYYYRASTNDGQEWAIVNPDFSPTLTFEALTRATGAGATVPSVPQAPRVDGLWTNKAGYAPGEAVTATARLSAPEERTVRQVVIAVRPKGGSQNLDFSSRSDFVVGPSGNELSATRSFPDPGTYEMFVGYLDDDGAWKNLAPTREFSVGTLAPSPAPAPAPAPPPNFAAPQILYPSPQGTTRDRTPILRAVVRDSQDNLDEGNVRLYVDGRRVSASRFVYSPSTDRLRYAPGRLPYGTHRVKVVASDDHGKTSSRSWHFRVVR